MSKEIRAELRGLVEIWRAEPKPNDAYLVARIRNLLPGLLDEMDEKDAEIERLSAALKLAQARAGDAEVDRDAYLSRYQKLDVSHTIRAKLNDALASDRDRYKARCEALERALIEAGEFERFYELAPCTACVNRRVRHDAEPCNGCLESDNYPFWQFDQARFENLNHT